MTNQNEMISKIATIKWLTRIDLARAYFQVRLTSGSQPVTALQTDSGTFSYVNGFIFQCCHLCQRLMDIVLRGAQSTDAPWLMILLVSVNPLRISWIICEMYSRVNTRKCHVATHKLHIFGFVVDNGKAYADQTKVKAILDWPLLTSKKKLRLFWGLTHYFHSFIHRYSKITFPLTEKLAKSKPRKVI